MSTGLYSTFTVADRYLGVPVERVQEVLRAQPITPVPMAHEHVEGLLNMRGQIVTALNLRARSRWWSTPSAMWCPCTRGSSSRRRTRCRPIPGT